MIRNTKKLQSYPEIAKEWHPTKNEGLDITSVSCASHIKAWWLGKCGHEYEMRVDSRTYPGRLSGCPYCNRKKKDCSLAISHPRVASEWHPTKNGELKPEAVTSGCVKKVWWLGKCGHQWDETVRNRAKVSGGCGCPYCANKRVDETNSLTAKFPEVSQEWHPTKNGELTPDLVNYSWYKRVWWLGKCGHEWRCLLHSRTRKLHPTGCPKCQASKGENKIKKCLQAMGVEFEIEVRFADCRNKRPLPFDFRIGNLLIEYQGEQHFYPVRFGSGRGCRFAQVQKHDQMKRDWCRHNRYHLLEIPYTSFDQIQEILEREVRY